MCKHYLKTKYFEDNKNTIVNIHFLKLYHGLHIQYKYYKLYQILHKIKHFETLI